MNSVMDQIQKLKSQIKLAVEQHHKLQKENSKLASQNEQLQVEKEVAINECEALKEQLKTIKLAQALAVPEKTETRELKIQINNYLREIDRCLLLLNKD
jgi:regulator of replication initiation timing